MDYKNRVILSQKDLEIINKSEDYLTVIAKRGPSKNTKIPLYLNEEMAFLAAAIIGDGHLKKSKMQITFECTNKEIIFSLQKVCKNLFNREFNYSDRKPRRNQKDSFQLRIDSKAIYNLLKDVFEISPGKKSDIVYIPRFILNHEEESIKSAFLIGIMVTEGGNRKRGFGLSTASKQLRDDLVNMFLDMKMKVLIDKWTNKKYKKEYYGLAYKKELFNEVIQKCQNVDIRAISYKCPNLFPVNKY